MKGEEQFIEQVEKLGFLGLPLNNYYDSLKNGEVSIIHVGNYKKKFGEDILTSDLTFTRNTETMEPKISSFLSTLRHIPPIVHGVYNTIDTHELEIRLAGIDWSKSSGDDGVLLGQQLAAIPELFAGFMKLRTGCDENAIQAAHRLMTKYWSNSLAEDYVNIADIRKQFEKTKLFYVDGALSDISLKDAYNLLSGRYVLKFEETHPNVFTGHWIGLSSADSNGQMMLETYPDFDLRKLYRKLPLLDIKSSAHSLEILHAMVAGELVQVTVDFQGNNIAVYPKVDPVSQKIELLDQEGNQLPDTAFLPVAKQKIAKQPDKGKKPPKPGKSRGKSI